MNLDEGVFRCFDARCDKQGDVIDRWASLHQQSLREAALDLVCGRLTWSPHQQRAQSRGTVNGHGCHNQTDRLKPPSLRGPGMLCLLRCHHSS